MASSMSKAFFADLKPIADHNLIAASSIYKELPADWVVVLTDVKNSTEAIEAGRYKDVNMVGVACIVAVQNALAGLSFPLCSGAMVPHWRYLPT